MGLEEAGIASVGKNKEGQDSSGVKSEAAAPKIDVGFLNSRSGTVGRDMEAELWKKAREFLDELQSGKNGERGGNGRMDTEDEEMSGA